MPRPEKENVEFFSHDVTGGKTLFALESRFGNDGYAFWFKLLELLGAEKGLFFDCNNDESWIYMVSRARVDEHTAQEIISLLARLNAIDKELWECGIIWCQNFVDRLDHLYKRRKTTKPEKPDISVIVTETSVIATETPVSAYNNDQSKVKESKVKIKGQVHMRKSGDLRDDENGGTTGEANESLNESLSVEEAEGNQESLSEISQPADNANESLKGETAQGENEIRSKTLQLSKKQAELFKEFWKAYPKKKSKGQAERTWKKIKADGALLGEMLEAIERAKQSRDWQKDGGQFIPHPATWLNARGWEDEHEPPDPPGGREPILSAEGREARDLGIEF
jgi:hypothetical protein